MISACGTELHEGKYPSTTICDDFVAELQRGNTRGGESKVLSDELKERFKRDQA